jgi:hypothetical protein
MDWFSRTTSIAGIQVPNWILVIVARRYLDYLLIRRTLKQASNSSTDQGRREAARRFHCGISS